MPTVLRRHGLRVVIHPNDHRPAHVHVIAHGCEAVFDLRCPHGPTVLRENFGFALREVTSIARLLTAELELLCEEWRNIHGQP
jgi:Domain of unknown function (DUF4160)